MTRASQIVIFCFVLCYAPHCFGQQDTLALKSYEALWELISEDFKEKKDTLRYIQLSTYALERAKTENNQEQVGLGYENYAMGIGMKRELKEAITAVDSAIHIFKSMGLKEKEQRAHFTKAIIYNVNFLINESIDSYYKALELAYENEDYATAYMLTNTIGSIKGSMEDYDGAIKILTKGLRSASNEDINLDNEYFTRRELKTSFNLNIALAHYNADRPDSTFIFLDRAEEIIVMPVDSCQLDRSFEIRANALVQKNKFKEAEEYLEKSTQYCRPLSLLDSLRWCNTKGGIYLGLKKYRASIETLKKGLKMYTVTPAEEKFMKDYYKNLAKSYKNLGILDSANYFLEKHLRTTSEYGALRNDLTSSFRDQEVAAFQKELNELSAQKAQKDNLLLYGSLAGGALILLLVVGLVRSNKQRKENEQKFEALLAKITAAREPEDIIDTKDEVLEEQATSEVNPETTQQILDGLKKLEEQNYFLHPACSAHNVAKRIKTNTTYLSKVINSEFGKNFSTYVNDLRINYAIVRLKQDSKFRSYTISSIATELGYKSADSFTKYFKKDTGLLPSFYIKKLNEAA